MSAEALPNGCVSNHPHSADERKNTAAAPKKKSVARHQKAFLEHIRMPSALLIITVRSQTGPLIKPAVCQRAARTLTEACHLMRCEIKCRLLKVKHHLILMCDFDCDFSHMRSLRAYRRHAG